MSHELDDDTGAAAVSGGHPVPAEEQDRDGCELIGGTWVPKHPVPAVIPDEDQDRDGWELVDGEWVEKGMSNLAAVVESNLISAVVGHARANKLGFVLTESAMYQMFADQPKLVRKPDLSFIRFGRLPGDKVPAGKMPIAPDLAAEVISPTDLAEPVEGKIDEYLRAGVRTVWAVYLPTRNVWAYKPDGTAKLFRAGDVLTGGDVLPGFSVPVAQLFEGV